MCKISSILFGYQCEHIHVLILEITHHQIHKNIGLAHTFDTRCLLFNLLWHSAATWHWRSWSTLVQVMACCLTAPSHYLNQCWSVINGFLCGPHQRSISQEVFKISIHILIMNLKHTRLTHWGQVKHICISNLTIIGSDNGLSPGRRQAIIWANAGILLNRLLGTNFSDILIAIYTLSFKKMKFKQWSEKWQPFCLSLNVLKLLPHLPGENELIFLTWITISSIPRIITAAWNTSVHTTARIPPWKFTHK